MKKLACILLVGLALFAVFKGGQMRMHNLETRAVHPDEGEQTWTFARLFLNGEYKYDPNGPHGPVLYYWPLMFLHDSDKASFDVKDLRKTLFPLYPVTAACIFLFAYAATRAPNAPGVKKNATPAFAAGAFAALLFAYSSLSQIYSTYFVQEAFFALFSLLFAYSFFYFWRRPSLWTALASGVSAGLLQVSKETSVFVYAAALAACMLVFALRPRREQLAAVELYRGMPFRRWALLALAAALPALAVYAAFNSSFGGNWQGVCDGVTSYFGHFVEKSASPAHSKGFFYYFELLAGRKSDYIFFGETGIFALALAGTVFAFAKRNDAARFTALFAWLGILLISAIGYKMPWLLFSPLCALCILGGIGAAGIFEIAFRPAWAATLLKAALFAALLWTVHFQAGLARTASVKYPSDPRNPFLYVHTLKNSEGLVKRVADANRVMDGGLKVLVAMKNSPWPLPWQFLRAGTMPDIARTPDGVGDLSPYSIIVYDSDFDGIFSGRFDDGEWMEEFFGLRENLLLRVRIKRGLFEKSISTDTD